MLGSSLFGLSAMAVLPSFPAVVATLTCLTLYAPIYLNRAPRGARALPGFILLTIAGLLPRFISAENALSTPSTGVGMLAAMSMMDAAILLVGTMIPVFIQARWSSTVGHFMLLPAVWSTIIWGVASLSPLGRLALPTPAAPTQVYAWLEPFFGPASIDILAGAWAVVLAEVISLWYMSKNQPDDVLIEYADHDGESQRGTRKPITIVGAILIILALPSFLASDLPLPLISDETTPISVGCALPSHRRYSHPGRPTFNDYIAETRKLVPSTDILLWPESAVVFDSVEHRNAKLEQVKAVAQGAYVGVGFLESFRENGKDHTRNGFALVSARSNEPDMLYFKRNLVPVAESYAMTPSTEPPALFTLPLKKPSDIPKSEWGQPPTYTRPIPLSASICLDFAAPNPFAALESRPALLLGPAYTWDVEIGRMMFAQGAQRARELGAAVLWCDGGENGVSGVAGDGVDKSMQVGRGSWVRTIAVPHPFSEQQTWFGQFGHGLPLLLVWLLVLGSAAPRLPGMAGTVQRVAGTVGAVSRRAPDVARRLIQGARERREPAPDAERRAPDEMSHLLD